jgi:hypothetical protein
MNFGRQSLLYQGKIQKQVQQRQSLINEFLFVSC